MKYKKRDAEDEGDDVPAWLCTFNDLTTLLMVFFVLLFTMSEIDGKKLKSFQSSLQSGLGILMQGKMVETGMGRPQPTYRAVARKKAQEEMRAFIEASLETLDSEGGLGVSYSEKGVTVSLEDTVLFESGNAKINVKAFPVLDRISFVLEKMAVPIRVEGYTDNVPINNERFPSNWELSTTRAVNVVKYFIYTGRISPERLSAVGYGASKPLFPNDTLEHRARNRRVEIVLVTEEER
ncbi:MAG: OmpA family protein [Thermodesulfobacteriota bacterium]|nr:OmpA family protein [Thermodesulfobacteriota bacterium]